MNDVAISIIIDEMFSQNSITTSLTLEDIINITRVNKHLRDYVGKYIEIFSSKVPCYITPYNDVYLDDMKFRKHVYISPRDGRLLVKYCQGMDNSYNIISSAYLNPKSTMQLLKWIDNCGFAHIYEDEELYPHCLGTSTSVLINNKGIIHIISDYKLETICNYRHAVALTLDGLNITTLCNSLHKYKLRSITNKIKAIKIDEIKLNIRERFGRLVKDPKNIYSDNKWNCT